jgi:uncharacterized membrane protein
LVVTIIHHVEAVLYFSRWAEAAVLPVAVDSVVLAAEAAALAGVALAHDGNEMRTKQFLSKLEHDQIVDAIRAAESNTSGEIRVYIQRGKLNTDPLISAQRKFHRLGMHKTRECNAVLIFIAPRAHKFAVVGDKAIHEKCGEEFWQRVVDAMRAHFQNEKFSDAILEGIEEIGRLLSTHFPQTSTSSNELPDDVIER